jgi:hypothetical protein
MFETIPARRSPSIQKWTRIAILLIGTVTVVGFIALSPILRTITKRDHDSAPVRAGTAIVEQIIPPRIEENTKPVPAQVWVRVNGSLAAARMAFGTAQLKVGQPAQVTYRIGRSGRVYVDRVEPLPASGDQPQK